jgi:hypothetical protein
MHVHWVSARMSTITDDFVGQVQGQTLSKTILLQCSNPLGREYDHQRSILVQQFKRNGRIVVPTTRINEVVLELGIEFWATH